MNALDWLLAALLTYSIVKGFLQGFLREAFALAGLFLGLLFAGWFYARAATQLAGLIASAAIAQFTAFLLILAVTMIAANVAGRLLHKTAAIVGLGILNRLAGAAFGLVRGCLLGAALLTAFTAFMPTASWIRKSKLAPYFFEAAHAVSFVMPTGLRHKLYDGAAGLKHTAPDWIKPGS